MSADRRRRAFTLRTRLTLAVLLLAGGAILVMGVVTYKTLESYLLGRVDRQMRVARVASVVALGTRTDVLDLPSSVHSAGGTLLASGTYAQLRHGAEVVDEVTFRYGQKEPASPQVSAEDVRRSVASGELFTVAGGGADGASEPRYRAGAWKLRPGYTLVVAIPLTELDATLHHMLVIEVLVGLGVLVVLVAAAWLLVRRGLRPLDDMATTADAIAGGDLTQRVEPAEPGSEVGRLGLALNAMLAQIERAFAAREASEQRLRRFLADASHELRTPLTSIRGYAELFRRGADERPEDLAVSMRRIEEEAKRMGVLVDDLLLLARLGDEREPKREPVNLAALVADCTRDARAADSRREITLSLPPASALDDPAVTGGDGRLRQVVANLLTNALRHTPADSPIEVTLAAEDARAVLRVRDHGPGLSSEQAERVFEPFFRADAGRSREDGGAGLGLAIVKAIVEAHDGQVSFEETAGGGATFVVRLPLRDRNTSG